MTVYNESKFPAPLSVQVLDVVDNPCKKADLKIQIAKDPKLKVYIAAFMFSRDFLNHLMP